MGFSLLIHDLGFVIVTAFVVSVVFDKLRLPSIFGFLLAGLLLGPHTFPDFSPISGRDSVLQLSELGILFLMFSIGMEFNIERVKRVLFPSFIAVCVQTIVLIFVGIQVAQLLEWNTLQAIFLAAMMALSSTMVAVSVLKDQKEDQSIAGNLAVGILVFEDILAILLLVILSGMGQSEEGAQLSKVIKVSGLIGIFVVCAYFAGRLFVTKIIDWIPKEKIANYVTIFAFAELMAFSLLAESMHFSAALGAFLAGAILVQSKLFHQIEEATKPLRDIFTAIFFVSVGMLIEPGSIMNHIGVILLLALVKIIGTFFSCSTGLMLAGIRPRNSVETAIVKSQLGEFAFVIAALGVSLNIFESEIISIVSGAAMISMFITPFCFSGREKIYRFLSDKSPQYARTLLNVHERVVEQFSIRFKTSNIKSYSSYFLKIFCYCFLYIGIVLIATVASQKAGSFVDLDQSYHQWIHIGIWSLCLIIMIYPVRGISTNLIKLLESTLRFREEKERSVVSNLLNIIFTVAISVVLGLFYLFLASSFISTPIILVLSISLSIVLILFFRQHLMHADTKMEKAFISSFYEEAAELSRKERRKKLIQIEKNSQFHASIREIDVPQDTAYAAKSIAELNIRKNFGVTILGTIRAGYIRFNPDPNSCIFPNDHLIVTGRPENIESCQNFLTQKGHGLNSHSSEDLLSLKLHRIEITEEHSFYNKTLSELDLRKREQISILYMIRGNEIIDPIDPNMIFGIDDCIYAIGNQSAIAQYGGTIVES